MANYVALPCGCAQEIFAGHKRPTHCECGNLFQKVREDGARKPRRSMKRTAPKRDWEDALRKVEVEGCCRICKRTDRKLDAGHVLGREHDQPKTPGSKTLYVDPDRIVPLCGPYPAGCHGEVDLREKNLLPFLTIEEQLRAVEDAGGIEAARIRLEPVNYNAEVREAASTRG